VLSSSPKVSLGELPRPGAGFPAFAKGWETTSCPLLSTQLHENGGSLIAYPGDELPFRAADLRQAPYGLQGRNAQVFADFSRQVPVDFRVTGHSGSLTGSAVNVDRMIGSFAQQFASVLLEVPKELSALQAPTFSGSRITSSPAAAS